jgi:histidinol phosphatase-like PHP family hydrolase
VKRAKEVKKDVKPADASIDVNTVIAGLLRDLAFVQTDKHKTWGYKRAGAAVFWLDEPIDALRGPNGEFPKIAGLGPASMRVVTEVLETGTSPTVERAVETSPKRADIERRRRLRAAALSRAATLQILRAVPEKQRLNYRGDFQMHSTWSDGGDSIAKLARACKKRGYEYCAVTDHSRGLPIAGGMSPASVRQQHRHIDQINSKNKDFRVLKGVEANIAADGSLDLTREELRDFELVLAAPHSKLRSPDDQTPRLLQALRTPNVHILAHPRGRIIGSRAGIVADWDAVFNEAVARSVAVEIDGDPSRQDLDYTIARKARDAGCLFALDSDAHNGEQLAYTDTALAHAYLAGIPAARIINTWPLGKLLEWARR